MNTDTQINVKNSTSMDSKKNVDIHTLGIKGNSEVSQEFKMLLIGPFYRYNTNYFQMTLPSWLHISVLIYADVVCMGIELMLRLV